MCIFQSASITDFSKPPCGAPFAFLEHIKIILTYSHLQCHSLEIENFFRHPEKPLSELLFSTIENIQQISELCPAGYQSSQVLCGPKMIQSFIYDANINLLPKGCKNNLTSPDLFGQNPLDVHAQRSANEAMKTKQKDGLKTSANVATLLNFLNLAEAGLCRTICENESHVAAGIRLLAIPQGPSLADVSPALFSPGYLQVCTCTPLIHCFMTGNHTTNHVI